MFKILSFSY